MSDTLIRLFTAFIPCKKTRKRLRRRLLDAALKRRLARRLPAIRARYDALYRACQAKLASGAKLKVAFLICDASMFSGESVYRQMLTDPRFECFIAVAPRVTRGEKFLRETLAKTLSVLRARYDGVVSLYDPDTQKSIELDADIVFSTIAYEDQTLAKYNTERLADRALVAMLYYGYGGLFTSNTKRTVFLPNIVYAWKYFVSNEATRKLWIEKNPLLEANLQVVGYAKMDRLAGIARTESPRKRVIICPHHSIERDTDGLKLSTFLFHAELFQKLPEMFPEVQFIFRPHPLLFARLATDKWWGAEKTAAYRAAMEAHPNVEFQQGGDYFETFVNSDALIHDCGSFLAEYFYTGRPQCYMLESDATLEQFLPFAQRLISHAYRAYTDDDIIRFIKETVLGSSDPMLPERSIFAKEEVCVNYPHSAESVVANLIEA